MHILSRTRSTLAAVLIAAAGAGWAMVPPAFAGSCVWKAVVDHWDTVVPTTTARAVASQGFIPTVTVTLTAHDNVGGSGVSGLGYEAVGAQPMLGGCVRNEPDSASMTVMLVIWARGETKISFGARDHQGNQETLKSITVFN